MKYLICIIFFIILAPLAAFASDCPFGRVNDPSPGQCVLYIDKDNNNICDNGQTVLGASAVEAVNADKTNYYLWQIIIGFIIFQLIGISLIQYNKLSNKSWRKINNYLLLISFIAVVFTSLFFLGNILNIIDSKNLRSVGWLHIESGFIMILFSLEHTIRRWQDFKINKKQK